MGQKEPPPPEPIPKVTGNPAWGTYVGMAVGSGMQGWGSLLWQRWEGTFGTLGWVPWMAENMGHDWWPLEHPSSNPMFLMHIWLIQLSNLLQARPGDTRGLAEGNWLALAWGLIDVPEMQGIHHGMLIKFLNQRFRQVGKKYLSALGHRQAFVCL